MGDLRCVPSDWISAGCEVVIGGLWMAQIARAIRLLMSEMVDKQRLSHRR